MNVMAMVDFHENGHARNRGEIFEMTKHNFAIWGRFVRPVKEDILQVTKEEKPPEDDRPKRTYTRKVNRNG